MGYNGVLGKFLKIVIVKILSKMCFFFFFVVVFFFTKKISNLFFGLKYFSFSISLKTALILNHFQHSMNAENDLKSELSLMRYFLYGVYM